MNVLALHLLLALLWIAFTGLLTGWNFVLGMTLAYVALWVTGLRGQRRRYFRKVRESIGFGAFLLKELVSSSLRVAHDVVTPHYHMQPAILAVELEASTDAEITILACLINLTPGTLTVDLSADRRHLFVYALYVDDIARTRSHIKEGFERRVLRLMR